MKQNKLENTIRFIGLDYKKEMIKLFIINLVIILSGVLLYIFTKAIVYSLFVLAALGGVDYFLISSYGEKKKTIINKRNEELLTLISYFETFINNNNNVYQAFSKLIDYSSLWMKERIQEFLLAIDNDKSVKPFIDFSSNFSMGSIKNVMLSIYQMIDQGENSQQILQFSFLFHEISKSRNEELKKKKERSLSSMTTFPLIGASALAVVLTLSIISIVGDIINVI